MALKHAQPFEAIDVRPLGPRLADTLTTSLIKTHSLQLMRVVLRAGESLPEHHVRGEITVQCLEGQVRLPTAQHDIALSAGQVVLLPAAEPHAVRALTDTTLLVTVSLLAPPEAAPAPP